MDKIKLGLWGNHFHQIHRCLDNYPDVELCVIGAFDDNEAKSMVEEYPEVVVCDDYDEFLNVEGLELVSLCAPVRAEQADLAMKALRNGINVYAEKPSATTSSKLEELIACAKECDAVYHEMAGTVFDTPYWKLKEIVESGELGEIVQVFAQKSYPNHGNRPMDERVDGGLIEQNGVHAVRFIEHITGLKCVDVQAIETPLGEERENSDLTLASSMMGQLENGGIFTVIANYLNQSGFPTWGNEHVRIFGTEGWVESVDAGERTRLVIGEDDLGEIDITEAAPDWFSLVLKNIRGEQMPFDLDKELHPTKVVVAAKERAIRVKV